MVVPCNVAGVPVGAALFQLRNARKQQLSLQRMGFHDLELFGRKASGLAQNGVRDGYLAYVVHDGGKRDIVDVLCAQTAAQLRPDEHEFRDVVDAPNMAARFAVAEFDGGGERFDHAAVEVYDLLGAAQEFGALVFHHIAEALSRLEQLDDGFDTAPDDVRDDGFANDVHNAQLVGLFHDRAARFGGDEEDGDLLDESCLVQVGKHLKAVHFVHHHVQKDGAVPAWMRQDLVERDFAVLRFFGCMTVGEQVRKDGAVNLLVVNDKERVRNGARVGFRRQFHAGPFFGARSAHCSCEDCSVF